MSAVASVLPVTVALPVLEHVPCTPVGLLVPGHALTAEEAVPADAAVGGAADGDWADGAGALDVLLLLDALLLAVGWAGGAVGAGADWGCGAGADCACGAGAVWAGGAGALVAAGGGGAGALVA